MLCATQSVAFATMSIWLLTSFIPHAHSYHMHITKLAWCLQGQAGMQQSSPKAKLSAGLNSSSPAASPLASLVASHPHPHAHGILVQSGAPSMVPPSHPKPIQTGPSGDSFPANRAAELARQTSKQVCQLLRLLLNVYIDLRCIISMSVLADVLCVNKSLHENAELAA